MGQSVYAASWFDNRSYRVTWEPLNTDHYTDRDRGTQNIAWGDAISYDHYERTYQTEIGPLTPGQFYVFYVYAKRSGEPEEDIVPSIQAGPAQWYHMDAARPDERIRIYEQGSGLGSGLVLDPALGGPTRVTTETALAGSVQLALVPINTLSGTAWQIDAASQSPEFAGPGLADPTTLISSGHVLENSLDVPMNRWYLGSGEFRKVELALSDGESIFMSDRYSGLAHAGELICFGTGPNFTGSRRFARICAVSQEDGVMIRGTAPNHYVEVEISLGYPGIPWA